MVDIEILVTLCTLPQQLFVFTKKTCLKNTHTQDFKMSAMCALL